MRYLNIIFKIIPAATCTPTATPIILTAFPGYSAKCRRNDWRSRGNAGRSWCYIIFKHPVQESPKAAGTVARMAPLLDQFRKRSPHSH